MAMQDRPGMGNNVADFEREVIELSRTRPVLVDFWAEWCGPCRVLGPVLERLAEKSGGAWELKKVDTEQLPDVAERFAVRSIPNVKLFVDGNVVNEFVGALPEPAVASWLARALPDKHQKEMDRAAELVREGKIGEAVAVLEPVVAADPANEHARALLALLTLFEDHRRSIGLVEGIHEAGPAGNLAAAVRTVDHLLTLAAHPESLPDAPVKARYAEAIECMRRKELDRALELFIDVIREDRKYDDDGARKACLAIFAYLGEQHPTTRSRRREFSSALY
jgi:putative thioredoxin